MQQDNTPPIAVWSCVCFKCFVCAVLLVGGNSSQGYFPHDCVGIKFTLYDFLTVFMYLKVIFCQGACAYAITECPPRI